MDWLLKVIAIWLTVDILVIATFWYANHTIKHLWPNWWQQVVITPIDLELGLVEPEIGRNYNNSWSEWGNLVNGSIEHKSSNAF